VGESVGDRRRGTSDRDAGEAVADEHEIPEVTAFHFLHDVVNRIHQAQPGASSPIARPGNVRAYAA
jgi:hypothetical protein